jgi:hypothetical protein
MNRENLGALRKSALALVTGAVFGLGALSAGMSVAQEAPPPHVPGKKQIGQTTQPEIVPSLIVINADGATLDGTTLTLTGIATNSIVFADRPVRAAGHAPTATIISEWDEGSDSFGQDPPNATVSVFGPTTDQIYDAVVVLKSPRMDGNNVVFDVDVLEGSLTGASGAAAVFIDIIGRPLTPVSFAGAARRTGAAAAWYGAGAVAAGAAVATDAAVAGAAAAYGGPPYCGFQNYPPCP